MPQELEGWIKRAEEALARQRGSVRVPRRDVEQLLRGLWVCQKKAAARDSDLRGRLEEAEQTIDAIRSGKVDAIVRSDGNGARVYTLEGPDEPYRNIVETMNAGAVTIDQQGVIFYSNGPFSRLTGIPLENLIGSSFLDRVIAEDLPLLHGFVQRTRKAGTSTGEIRMKSERGSFFAGLAGSRQKIYGSERLCIVVTDISRLKAAEESLQEAHDELEQRVEERTGELAREKEALRKSKARLRASEETLRLAIDSTGLGIWDYYPRAGRLDWSDNVKHQFGLPPDATPDYALFVSAIHPDDRARVIDHIDKMLAPWCDEKDCYLEYRAIGIEDRKERWIAVWAHPYRDHSGETVRIVGTSLDVTKRKKVEEEIRRSRDELELRVRQRTEALHRQTSMAEQERDRLVTLLDSMTDGVWVSDAHGRIVLANPAAKAQAAQLGLDADNLDESFLSRIDVLTLEGNPFGLDSLFRVFSGESLSGVEVALRYRASGETFYRRISANPLRDKEKRIIGAVAVVQDTTHQKRAEEERARLEGQLRQAQKMEAIGTLAGGIAHDFNNMLAVIIGNAELALDDVHAQEPRRNIEQIVKASRRARDLVRQILTFSRRKERGKAATRVVPLVEETFRLLRGSLPSTIHMDLDVKTDSDMVVADPSEIQQVLMNLATNGAHAMRERGGSLTIGVSGVTFGKGDPMPDPDMNAGKYLKLTVRDTGTGISDRIRSRIFEPFFTTKQPGEGTGMGLAVVFGIVNDHGGAITVESTPGEGSLFTVFLPKGDIKAQDKKEEKEDLPHGTERILLVDDEHLVREMASQTLSRLGYNITTAENGTEAMAMFLETPYAFDLVITDQTMPDLTGIALARRMLEKRKELPVILFTGYSEAVSPE